MLYGDYQSDNTDNTGERGGQRPRVFLVFAIRPDGLHCRLQNRPRGTLAQIHQLQLAIETANKPDKQGELTPVAGRDSLTFDDRRRRRSAVRLIVRLRGILALGRSQIYQIAGGWAGLAWHRSSCTMDAISSLAGILAAVLRWEGEARREVRAGSHGVYARYTRAPSRTATPVIRRCLQRKPGS